MKQFAPEGTADTRDVATAINELIEGNNNATTTISLTTGTTTKIETAVEYIEINENSVILFTPLSSGSASELYSGNMYILESDIKNGEFTITHSVSSDGLEFRVLVTGGSNE